MNVKRVKNNYIVLKELLKHILCIPHTHTHIHTYIQTYIQVHTDKVVDSPMITCMKYKDNRLHSLSMDCSTCLYVSENNAQNLGTCV